FGLDERGVAEPTAKCGQGGASPCFVPLRRGCPSPGGLWTSFWWIGERPSPREPARRARPCAASSVGGSDPRAYKQREHAGCRGAGLGRRGGWALLAPPPAPAPARGL